MIEEIINLFTDSLTPKSVIMWFHRRVSYKKRINKSVLLANSDLLHCLSDVNDLIHMINAECISHKAEFLLLTAYPVIDENIYWQCIGIDKKYRYLFELRLNVSKSRLFNLENNKIYHILLNNNNI